MAKVALLIGVGEYGNGLSPLRAAALDVEAMRQVLEDPEIGGFDGVTLLINPERQAMEEAIYTLFANRKKDDLLLLFFSGHGVKDDNGNLYLAVRNTRKEQEALVQPTAVAASYIQNIMSNSRSKRQVVILDCCFSGAFAEGMKAKDDGSVPVKEQLGGEGRAVLTSSTSTQYSFEHPGFDLSIYTHFLVEGISTGVADGDRDGAVSVDELHEYASEKVEQTAPGKMKPKIYVVEEGFKILLAKVRVDDPKLKYRQEVERRLRNGKIPSIARNLLDLKRESLKLLPEEAAVIQAEVLKPYREYETKLQQYEQLLSKAIQDENPLSEYTSNQLKDYQEFWGLKDEDVELIKNRIILPKQEPLPQPINPPQPPDPSPKPDKPIKPSIESKRSFEAAMPEKSKVGQRTEIRVMVALPDSPGLRAHLPSWTDAGDVITKKDVVGNDAPLEFPIHPTTHEPLPINIFVAVTAPDFEIEQATKNLLISPNFDSGIITFFLTPLVRQKLGRVRVELFKDKEQTILVSSLTLITEVWGRQDELVDVVWHVAKFTLSLASATSRKRESLASAPIQSRPSADAPMMQPPYGTMMQPPPPVQPPEAQWEEDTMMQLRPFAPPNHHKLYHKARIIAGLTSVVLSVGIYNWFVFRAEKVPKPSEVQTPISKPECFVNLEKAKEFYEKGRANYEKRLYEEAIKAFDRVICYSDEYYRAYSYTYRGMSRYELGDQQGALQDYNRAISIDSSFAHAYYNRGKLYLQQGQKQEAKKDYLKAAALYQQQSDTDYYQKVQESLKQLGT